MVLKYMILNGIEIYDFKCNWNLWFLNFIKKKVGKMLKTLTSRFLFANKSLTISTLSFSTAVNNAVLSNNIKISLKNMILNYIEI